MGFDVSGKLVAKFEIVQRTESFKTREFVIETSEDIKGRIITNYIKFQSVQDRTTIIDRFNIGDQVKVHFNIRGTRWEKNGQVNYITNLDAWRIEAVNLQQGGPASGGDITPAFQPDMSRTADGVDDLPF